MPETQPGQWVLFRRSVAHDALTCGIAKVLEVYPKRIVVEWPHVSGRNYVRRDDVLGAFATEREAKAASNRVASVKGERDRRLMSAHDWATRSVRQLKEGWAQL